MAESSVDDSHRGSRPPPDGLIRLAAALGCDTPRVLRRLGGGLDSATHLLVAGGRRLVLKRYPPGSDVPELEWQGLSFARSAGLRCPAPVAVDQDGRWFDSPALVMEAAPGRPDVSPKDRSRYVEEVATTLADIHSAETTDASGALLRPHSVDGWIPPEDVPDGLMSRSVACRVIEVLASKLERAERGGTVLNHGDFHPGNLLWKRDCLSAVVDWSATRLGPRWWELAYFRTELAVLADARTADMLLKSYEVKVGVESSQQAVWDLLCLYDGHRWGHHWLIGYKEQGRRDLTLETLRRRLTRLAQRALATLDP